IANTSLKVFFIAYSITYFILFCSALLKRKYSVHVAGFCSTIPLLVNHTTVYYLNPFIILPPSLIVLGLIASARWYLNAHTNVEIILGSIIGFISSFILFYNMYNITPKFSILKWRSLSSTSLLKRGLKP